MGILKSLKYFLVGVMTKASFISEPACSHRDSRELKPSWLGLPVCVRCVASRRVVLRYVVLRCVAWCACACACAHACGIVAVQPVALNRRLRGQHQAGSRSRSDDPMIRKKEEG